LDGFSEREGRDAVGEGGDREEESGIVVHRHVSRGELLEWQFCKLLKKKTGVLRILEK
jgi:hypothetical protein